mmetsp:Transcript_42034/g.127473  ORF Transcript_42034/g.127473 Transcript_42034/m.127473 type:complete len:160 (-) Transcript_42034:188-667(-)
MTETGIEVSTPLGSIRLVLLRNAAPVTCDHIAKLVRDGLYDGTSFYRSDFVVQMGLHGRGKRRRNPHPDLSVNETSDHARVSNVRGTAAVAHFDVPDCGNSEFFINLRDNPHLDGAYGGYCCFARVDDGDEESFATVDRIAEAIASKGGNVEVRRCRCY